MEQKGSWTFVCAFRDPGLAKMVMFSNWISGYTLSRVSLNTSVFFSKICRNSLLVTFSYQKPQTKVSEIHKLLTGTRDVNKCETNVKIEKYLFLTSIIALISSIPGIPYYKASPWWNIFLHPVISSNGVTMCALCVI